MHANLKKVSSKFFVSANIEPYAYSRSQNSANRYSIAIKNMK